MIKIDKPQILSQQEQNIVLELVPAILYERESFLFYENQIPHCAILLVGGELKLYKKKNVIKVINDPGTLIGAYSLINSEASPYALKISANSQMSLVGRSTLKELMQNKLTKMIIQS